MRIMNIRLGFATNSSSTHSVVYATDLKDHNIPYDMQYGWENFILSSREEKLKYLATAIYYHYKCSGNSEIDSAILANNIVGLNISISDYTDSYIDHQSMPNFPSPRIRTADMRPLFLIIKDMLTQNNIAVLGGSDNYPPLPLFERHKEAKMFNRLLGSEYRREVFVLDQHHIALFNSKRGDKVRIALGPNNPEFSTHPELIDVKITDYCNRDCAWCYQDSSKTGVHAEFGVLRSLAEELRDTGVFEVALGGGEPTTHPRFIEILKMFKESGVVPNFSTGTTNWIEDESIVRGVQEYCGAVALSNTDPACISSWVDFCESIDKKPVFHYVLGTTPLNDLEKFLVGCSSFRTQVVLLAPKKIGRGRLYNMHSYLGWHQTIKIASRRTSIAVDSALSGYISALLPEIDPVLYEAGDGKFSAYYNAVRQVAASSSFSPEVFPCSPKDLMRVWKKIHESACSGAGHEI